MKTEDVKEYLTTIIFWLIIIVVISFIFKWGFKNGNNESDDYGGYYNNQDQYCGPGGSPC